MSSMWGSRRATYVHRKTKVILMIFEDGIWVGRRTWQGGLFVFRSPSEIRAYEKAYADNDVWLPLPRNIRK